MASDSNTASFCKLRTYQVVVAASRNLGLGKDRKMAWDLPLEYNFFLTITRNTTDPTKRNAVIMGRKTWEATPLEHRPHVGVLNVVVSRSENFNIPTAQNVVICRSLISALELLASSPYCQSIERVFLIGGGEILKDSLNARECDAIHLTEIDAEIECDTFIPPVDTCVFQPWYSSFPTVENKLRYSFVTYVRVKKSSANDTMDLQNSNIGLVNLDGCSSAIADIKVNNFSFLPKMILQRHEEYMYLRLVQDIISNGTLKLDKIGKTTLSKFGSQMRFNLRKSFPLLTTKRVYWQGVVEELLGYISGSRSAKVDRDEHDLEPVDGLARYIDMKARYKQQGFEHLLDAIDKIKNNPDGQPILLSPWNPSDLNLTALYPCHMFAQFYVANGELSCQIYHHSADMYLGVPFNIAYYALLTCMIAHVCDIVPGDFVHVIGDAHVYCTHVRAVEGQIQKQPKPFPILKIKTMEKDIHSFVAADFDLLGYDPYQKLDMNGF